MNSIPLLKVERWRRSGVVWGGGAQASHHWNMQILYYSIVRRCGACNSDFIHCVVHRVQWQNPLCCLRLSATPFSIPITGRKKHFKCRQKTTWNQASSCSEVEKRDRDNSLFGYRLVASHSDQTRVTRLKPVLSCLFRIIAPLTLLFLSPICFVYKKSSSSKLNGDRRTTKNYHCKSAIDLFRRPFPRSFFSYVFFTLRQVDVPLPPLLHSQQCF